MKNCIDVSKHQGTIDRKKIKESGYAPTNRELYEMILALQNGGNS